MLRCLTTFAALLVAFGSAHAGVLPDDRTDVLYHLYDGGGVEIDGPSVLVRKKVGNSVSVVGNYYVDMVSSASINGSSSSAVAMAWTTSGSPHRSRTQWTG